MQDKFKIKQEIPDNTLQDIDMLANHDPILLFLILTGYFIIYMRIISGVESFTVAIPRGNRQDDPILVNMELPENLSFCDFLTRFRSEYIQATRHYGNAAMAEKRNGYSHLKLSAVSSSLHGICTSNLLSCCDINLHINSPHIHIDNMDKRFMPCVFNYMTKPLLDIIDMTMKDKKITIEQFDFVRRGLLNTQENGAIHGTVVELAKEDSISVRFMDIADRFGKNIALVVGEKSYTFSMLKKRALQIAFQLKKYHGTCIAILGQYDFDMIASVFAVLLSGNAYVPLDSTVPEGRMRSILAISQCAAVIIPRETAVSIPSEYIERIELPYTDAPQMDIRELGRIQSEITAYVLYTSGTTGEPKAIPICNKGLINFCLWKISTYSINQESISLQPLSFMFDAFAANLFPVLLSGGRVVLVDQKKRQDFSHVAELIVMHSVNIINIVPSHFEQVAHFLSAGQTPALKTVIFGGEPIKPGAIDQCRRINENTVISNEYGPTENSITTTYCFDITDSDENRIGVPIFNNTIYVLNANGKPCPPGVTGELHITGPGLMQGYLGTTQQPFIEIDSQRVYPTGDFVFLDEANELHFNIRSGSQVSINGFRVDLIEIEKLIQNLRLADDSIAFIERDKHGNSVLAVLLTWQCNTVIMSAEPLKQELEYRLPEYMVPKKFYRTQQILLTENGKKARYITDTKQFELLQGFLKQAKTPTELALENIWKELLETDSLSIDSNFFTIGGNSMLVMELYERITALFGNVTSIPDLFTHNTIETSAAFIDNALISEMTHR